MQRILILVAEAAETQGAGLASGIGVDAQFQPFRVDIVRKGLHAARKTLGVALRKSVGVALGGVPAVVDIDVNVSGIGKARSDQRVGDLPDHPFIDVAGEFVPRTPAHRRSVGKALPLLGVGDRRTAKGGTKQENTFHRYFGLGW